MRDVAQLPTPTMATRIDPMPDLPSFTACLRRFGRRRHSRCTPGVFGVAGAGGPVVRTPFGVDEVGTAADLARHVLERVPAHGAQVAVGAAGRVPLSLQALLEAAATALEDPETGVGAGPGEEREPHVEALVLRRARPVVGDL